MEMESRYYSGPEDHLDMMDAARAFPGGNIHLADIPYRLSSWALDEPMNGRLWLGSQGRLAGWAVLQTPFWTLDLAAGGENQAVIFQSALEWADRRARQVLGSEYGHEA